MLCEFSSKQIALRGLGPNSFRITAGIEESSSLEGPSRLRPALDGGSARPECAGRRDWAKSIEVQGGLHP